MAVCALAGCKQGNPLLEAFDTPYQTPPFDKILPEHYEPAFIKGIELQKADVEAIIANPEAPTFENTIVALDRAGELLNTVSNIFFNVRECCASPELDTVAVHVMPLLTQASNDIALDERIFARVKQVWDNRESIGELTPEQAMLLEKTYKGFTRKGANLSEQDKQTYRDITEELANLSLSFSNNALAATNAFEMYLTEAQVAGLPDFAKDGMAMEATQKGKEGSYLLTLKAPTLNAYMTYATDRDVKKQAWFANSSRCLGGEFDNSDNIRRIAELRMRMANLLGYETYADYALEERMAGDRATVNAFLAELLAATRPYADKDMAAVRAYAAANGLQGEMMPWDWGYYQEKLKEEKFSFNEEAVKPYFQLEKVQEGIFALADRLYGLTFKLNPEIQVFHPEVSAYEVYDASGRMMAILYMDFFPRDSKRGGAWMTNYRELYVDAQGNEKRPLVSLTCNFTKPTATAPSLLTFGEVETFLHEFGHCLHSILSEGTYMSVTGTNVYRDFVELPSQIMENWASEKEFLDMWAVHYQTGEKMPAELIEKIVAAQNYLAPYLSVRQLFFGMDDMAWHSITAPVTEPVDQFENRATKGAQLFTPQPGTCVATSFSHIFPGGYAAGYYSYKWSEVLEADAFEAFKEAGIFNPEVAARFRTLLSKGGTEKPMELYKAFRGHEPSNKALLRKMGIEVK